MKIYTKEQIEKAIDVPYLIAEIEKGLILYSEEKAIIAPSSFLHYPVVMALCCFFPKKPES